MNRIVAGVDGSPAATTAALWAAHEAAMRNVELTVLHVVHSAPEVWPQMTWPAVAVPPVVGEAQLAEGERIIEDTVEVLAKAAGSRQPRRITTRLCVGAIVPTLAGLTDEKSQMVVVGRRGRGGLRRALLGSVSSALVHTAQCPVTVVHHHVSPVPPSGAPVVVGIDGSTASQSAIAIAFDEASRRAVELITVHATDHADPSEAKHLLMQRLEECQQRYPNVTVRPVVIGAHPADALLDQSQQAQLVVVGSRGRGGLAGKILGSVSAAVVQACRIPVIVAGRARPHTPSAPAHLAPETCPTTSTAGSTSAVGVAQSQKGSTELAAPPHWC